MSSHENITQFRKVLYITLLFNALEIIKDITLSSLGLIPFLSFWFFFVLSFVNMVTLIFTFKLQSWLKLINLGFLVFLCIFYTFCYYYIDNIEFSLFLSMVLFVFSMHGNYIRSICLTVICFMVLTLSFINTNFASQIERGLLTIWAELQPLLSLPFLAAIWSIYILSWSLFLYWMEIGKKLDFW
jgi:hypothetical protein